MAKSNKELVAELAADGAIRSADVRRAFLKTDRADFVPGNQKKSAYANYPLPIGEEQTISQPFTVAVMTEALDIKEGHKVLEVGTGSGYQAAILSNIVGNSGLVVTTEFRKTLHESAAKKLLKYKNIIAVLADGSKGYKEKAPYDRIIVTASGTKVPEPLLGQLKENGVMVIPIGNEMHRIEKAKGGLKKTFLGHFAFVPLKE